jgi:hypothetical protein
MVHTADMKFDDHSSSNDHNLHGCDPHLEGLGRDYWQRHADDEYYHYLNRQEQAFFRISNNAPQIVEIDHMNSYWCDHDAEHSQPTIVRMLSGGVTLGLLGYLYWML